MASRPSTRGSGSGSGRAVSRSPLPPAQAASAGVGASAESAASELRARALMEHSTSSEDALTLRSSIMSLQTEIGAEQSNLTHFTALKAATLRLYEGETERKRRLKLSLRDQLAEKAELQDSRGYDTQLMTAKMKQSMADHTEQLNALRIGAQEEKVSVDLAHRSTQSALMEDARGLVWQQEQMQLSVQQLLHRLHLSHEQATMRMRETYERQSQQLRAHYLKVLKNCRDVQDEAKKKALTRLEHKKQAEVTHLLTQQKRAMEHMKKYYSDITHANLELIKALKEEVGDMKKKELSCSVDMRRMERHCEKLQQPLAENERSIRELQERLIEYRQQKFEVEQARGEDQQLTAEMEAVAWEVEVLTQKVELVKAERDRVRGELVAAQLGQAQVSDFSALVMARQVGVLRGEVEKAEAGLSEMLLSTGVVGREVGGVGGRGLEELLMDKNALIVQLEDEVQEWKARFKQMMREYQEEMRAHNIPPEELGFIPVQHI